MRPAQCVFQVHAVKYVPKMMKVEYVPLAIVALNSYAVSPALRRNDPLDPLVALPLVPLVARMVRG